MLSPKDVLPSGSTMYADDTAAIMYWDGEQIEWFDKDELSVGTEIDTDKFYEIFNRQYNQGREDWWKITRSASEDILIRGFLGSSDVHVCSLHWRGWTLRTIHVHPKDRHLPINMGHTYLWAPNTAAGKLILMELKLILG